MRLIRQCSLIKVLFFLLIPLFLLNILPVNFSYAQDQLNSNLSPEIAINQYDFSQALRALIIDSYIAGSLLSEFEYRVLKLDIIFNVRTNPAHIEQQIRQLVSKDDLLSYFSTDPAASLKRYKVRLKVRDLFNAILEENGYDQFSLGEYQDKIIEKLLEEHNKYLAQSGKGILDTRIWHTVQRLSADEILLFAAQASSPEEHALNKKIKLFISSGLMEEGIILDQKVWDLVSEKIQARRNRMLDHFEFYTEKYDKELKKRLMTRFTMREIAYYSADTADFNLERQQIRREVYDFFMEWLAELDNQIEQSPHTIRLFVYNQGKHWQSRYNALLDKIMRELVEIDVDSYDLSLKKMLGQKIVRNADMKRALDIIVLAQKEFLSQKPVNFDLYHRIRAINTSYINNFAYVDEIPVLYIDDGIYGRKVFVADELYLIEQGNSVFYQTIDPKTGENQVFVFSQQAPFVEVKKIKNDYSQIFKDNLKAHIAENLSHVQAEELIAYVAGSPVDWDEGYEIGKRLANICEKFFEQKFRLNLSRDAWRVILEALHEYIDGKNTLTQAENEFVKLALPFTPQNNLMRLTGRDYGIFPLPKGQLFQQNIGQIKFGQSI